LNPYNLSRRELLIAGGGIAVTNLSIPALAVETTPDKLGKDLIFRTTDPRNGEPELSNLVKSWVTPTKHFYVRSHAPNPQIDVNKFSLTVEGKVRTPLTLTMNQLSQLPRHHLTATLTCAGNRRVEFNSEGKVGGVQWAAGPIGNAKWSGFALADVLKKAEILEEARHVWFEGLDEIQRTNVVIPFGGSIPIEKAMITGPIPGAVLADQMNEQPLSPDHGYPLRTIVPGYVGARSVKWLGKIVVSDKPSPNHYLAAAYKLVKKTDPIDWTESGPIYRYPINGAIATPDAGTVVPAGRLDISGYVLPTGLRDSRAQRIEISTDNGINWTVAKTTGQDSAFCWQLWNARVKVTSRTNSLIMRAFDSSGGFMPQRVPWNAKGYLQNSWYRLPITVS